MERTVDQHSDPLLSPHVDVNSKQKNACCDLTPSWVKTFLIFFTLIILAIALAFIGLGSYFTITRGDVFPKILGELAYINNYLMIGVGILLTLVCIFGFVAISKNDPGMLKLYAVILAIALIIQLCAAGAAVSYYSLSYDWMADSLAFKIKNEYHLNSNTIVIAINKLQKDYRCCGSRSFRDWTGSRFEEIEFPNNYSGVDRVPMVVPGSCCIRLDKNCGKIIHPSNINYEGCMSKVSDNFNEILFIIFVVLLALAVVELIGVILACCYWKAPKYSYN